VLAEEQQGQH
jgi:hypothetical protein